MSDQQVYETSPAMAAYSRQPGNNEVSRPSDSISEELDQLKTLLAAEQQKWELAISRVSELEKEISRLNLFISTISHELRTPLNTARGYLDILLGEKAGQLREKQAQFVSFASTGLAQACGLAEDLLNRHQLETGELSLDINLVELNTLISSTLQHLELLARQAGVTLDYSLPVEEACHVLGEERRLRQCLQNLITNAIKFSPSGGTIKIQLRQNSETYRITVEDQGPGITPENLALIFQRGVHSTNSNLAGYGLGLAITKSLVEAQGGRVGVESILGEGSSFWIELPRADYSCPES